MLTKLIKNKLLLVTFYSLTIPYIVFADEKISAESCALGQKPNYSLFSTLPAEVWRNNYNQALIGTLPNSITEQLDKASQKLLAKTPAYSIAIGIPNKGLWFSQKGFSNANTQLSLSESASFQVASITKAFTASIIMQLLDEKKLDLNDSVDKYYTGPLTLATHITIEHLLMHTSGLANYNSQSDRSDKISNPKQLIEKASKQGLNFCPGTAWEYSNTGYILLGIIIETVEKKSLNLVIKERITDPLDLNNTMLRTLSDKVSIVTGHQSGNPMTPADTYTNAYAAGGISSTAKDLVVFWHALLSGKIVSEKDIKKMYASLAPMDPKNQMFYGLGVQFYNIQQGPGFMLGHSGSIQGFKSIVAYIPADNVYIAVIFNDQSVPAEAGLWHLLRTIRKLNIES